MSNVIIGIIGVILFIGLALAGATYFGPRVTQSTSQAQAGVVMSELVSISNAVKVRDQERQMATTGGFDLDFLAPDYLGDEIGRASCRERVCQYVSISVVAVSLKKKTQRYETR